MTIPTEEMKTDTKTLPRHQWNESKPMWVIGTIDGYGAIRGRASKSHYNSPMHSAKDGPGHRWRWNVWGQEFHSVLGAEFNLTSEESALVREWLAKKGYIYERAIISTSTNPPLIREAADRLEALGKSVNHWRQHWRDERRQVHALKKELEREYAENAALKERATTFSQAIQQVLSERDSIQEQENLSKEWLEKLREENAALKERVGELEKGHARYEALRKLNVQQFSDLFERNIKGENFDEMVDQLSRNP